MLDDQGYSPAMKPNLVRFPLLASSLLKAEHMVEFDLGRISRSILCSLGMLTLALARPVFAAEQSAPLDMFIGTIALENDEIVLTRCDLAENRYILHDAKGARAVADYRKSAVPAYAEVTGSYGEEGGQSMLSVAAIENLTPGRNCHLLDALSAVPSSVASPEAISGHYYLSGVMETGSELLLSADGSFEWFISYGAVDQFAKGHWDRQGDEIVLTAVPVATSKPLFAYLETEEWSQNAEDEMQRRKKQAAESVVHAGCSSVNKALGTSTPVPQRPQSDVAAPALPEPCPPPFQQPSVRHGPKQWAGGIGIRVYDIDSAQGVRDVQVSLRFADGHEARLTTAGRGLGILPKRSTSAVISAALHADFAPGRDITLTFSPVTSGIIYVSIDARQLAQPAFTVLRLRIDGKVLIPESFGRGRYERQP